MTEVRKSYPTMIYIQVYASSNYKAMELGKLAYLTREEAEVNLIESEELPLVIELPIYQSSPTKAKEEKT